MPYRCRCAPVFALVWFLSPLSVAQEATSPPEGPAPVVSQATADAASNGLTALMAGTLEPWVDPSPWLPLALPQSPTDATPVPDDAADDGLGQLRRALESWHGLGAERQQQLLALHALRGRAFALWQQDAALLAAWPAPLPEEAQHYLHLAQQITALGRGELDLAADPATLLTIDLAASDNSLLTSAELAWLVVFPSLPPLEAAPLVAAPDPEPEAPAAPNPGPQDLSPAMPEDGAAPEATVPDPLAVAEPVPPTGEESPEPEAQPAIAERDVIVDTPAEEAAALVAPTPEPSPDPAPVIAAAYRERLRAISRFLSLPEGERREHLVQHARRQEEARRQAGEAEALQELAERHQQSARQLAELLQGTLDLEVDPAPLLRFDLLDRALADSLLSRLALPTGFHWQGTGLTVDGEGPEGLRIARQSLRQASQELSEVLGEILRLTPAERDALVTAHLARRAAAREAEEAAAQAARDAAAAAVAAAQLAEEQRLQEELALREQQEALQAARVLREAEERAREHEEALARARQEQEEEHRRQAAQRSAAEAAAEDAAVQANAAKLEAEAAERERARALAASRQEADAEARLVADERARLAGYRMDLARFEADLLELRTGLKQGQVGDLAIHQRLTQLQDRKRAGESVGDLADTLWDDLQSQLDKQRLEFAQILSRLFAPSEALPSLGPALDPAGLADDVRTELAAAWEVAQNNRTRLEALEDDVLWEAADALAQTVTALNRDRLAAIPLLSYQRRATVTGFGEEGLQQVTGALHQAYEMMRYRIAAAPRLVRRLFTAMREDPVQALRPLLISLLFLGALIWWIRRGHQIRRPEADSWDTPSTRQTLTRYVLERVWAPLGWLLFSAAALLFSGLSKVVPESRLLWPVVAWLAGGLLVVRLIDALIDWGQIRQPGKKQKANSPLRNRSLRLLGLSTVSIGLLLSLTEEALGRGAVYRWVLSTCWVLAVPLGIVLLVWWRKPIRVRLIERRGRNRLVAWCVAHNSGAAAWVSDALGGLYLLVSGLADWSLRWLGSMRVARRIHAWLFRRQVARQARLQTQEALGPISPQTAAAFRPGATAKTLLENVYQSELTDLSSIPDSPAENLVLVVGNRGMGKSTLLGRLAQTHGESNDALVVRCSAGPFEATMDRFREALGAGPEEDVLEALTRRAPSLVCVDDTQLLVRPVVRGLRDLDRLMDVATAVGPGSTWVMTMSTSAWLFVSRARSGSFLFDRVLRLESWDEGDIGRLIQSRCQDSGISPSFDGLVFQARPDDWVFGQRAEQIGESYYRVLWSAADGNPAVALEYWRESLRQRPDGTLAVRLFEEPSQLVTDHLPLNLLFLLRALLQIDRATVPEISDATGLPRSEVMDGLRHCLTRGFIRQDGDAMELTWRWYTPVLRTLIRQHLLVP
jgi:uncharacterized protein YjeT (DUF2065 family)